MNNSTILATAIVISLAGGAAAAQDLGDAVGISGGVARESQDGKGLGVGAQVDFGSAATGRGGALAATYDLGPFHADALAIVQVVDDGPKAFGAVGHFWYVLHRSHQADFSVGGGGGVLATNARSVDGSTDLGIVVETGAKIRVFIVPNVALNFTLGAGALVIEEGATFGTFGQVTGGAGITYFFASMP